MSGAPPVLHDLAAGPHDFGYDENEEQGIRVEKNRRIEGGEEAAKRNAGGQPGIGEARSPQLDQFLALVSRRLRFPRRLAPERWWSC